MTAPITVISRSINTDTLWINTQSKSIGRLELRNDIIFVHDGKEYEIAAANAINSEREIIGYYDGWKVARFLMWKPLIYWAVYGSDTSFEMFKLSVLSLYTYGSYDGEILVISDKPREYILQYVPADMAHRCHVHHRSASDILGYTIARYDVFSWDSASIYGPLLYIDTDVLIDTELRPVLSEICVENRIIGQGGIGPLWRDMGVGSHMLAADGFEIPKVYPGEQGLCTGTLGIPSVEQHRSYLALFIDAIERYAKTIGERGIGWYDQPTVNYVLYKLLGECPNTISNYVRWGGKAALHGGDRPCGMVHLWGAGNKLREMSEFMRMLGGDDTNSSEWVVYGKEGKMESCNFAAASEPA